MNLIKVNTINHLKTLQNSLKHHSLFFKDPIFNNIVHEIILRIEVELAKLEQNIDFKTIMD